MKRRSLIQGLPLLALPLPAIAEPKRGGLPVVTFVDMLEEVTFKQAHPLPPNSGKFWVGGDHESTHLLIFDSRPSVKECRLDIEPDDHTLVEALRQGARSHQMALMVQVVETACQLAFEDCRPEGRPDFTADRSFMLWSVEDQATLVCTTKGPLGYRWDDGQGHHGAIAFPERVTSAWLQRGPRRV